MNSYERLQRRLRNELVDRPPNFDIMMQFAAHYIEQDFQNERIKKSFNSADPALNFGHNVKSARQSD
jgi:hypothetical protein